MAQRTRRQRRFVLDDDAIETAQVDGAQHAAELRDEIEWAVAQLPSEQREAFLLRHVEELSYDEMAAATGAGVSALKMRVKRASERLKILLAEGANVDDRR
jgi:RNA polymerase sigma-70 factor (ECF subfamily)